MKNIIVTTSVKTTSALNNKAQKLANELNLKYIIRNKKTIKKTDSRIYDTEKNSILRRNATKQQWENR